MALVALGQAVHISGPPPLFSRCDIWRCGLDWYPFFPVEYRADTLDFSLEEDGAYRRLIDHYMETRMPLPNNNAALARIIGISFNDFQPIAEKVLGKFLADGDVLRHKRCDIELDRQDNISNKRSEAGKRAAAKRNKNKAVQAIDEQMLSKGQPQDKTGQDNKDIDAAVAAYHTLADKKGLPRVRSLTSTRRKKLKSILTKHGQDGWSEALKKVEHNGFLCGDNDRGWRADFDFMVTESRFVKVLEGSYGENERGGKPKW